MKSQGLDYRSYLDAAVRMAHEAGELLLRYYRHVEAREKGPGDLVTDADIASQRLVAARIADAFPTHTLLAEEEGATPDLDAPWRWIVDPLDGTMNFAHGFPFWAVSIGLEHEGVPVVGVVFDPVARTTYAAAHGRGATLNGEPIRVSPAKSMRNSLIATALPADVSKEADRQMAYMRRFSIGTHSVRRTGSSALNLSLLAAGRCEVCYATWMHPWDAAAGVVLVREAGGVVSDLDGTPYNLYGGSILATNGHVHDDAVRFLAEAWSE